MKAPYKNASAKVNVRRITEQFRGSIDGKITDYCAETKFGRTYVLEVGDRSKQTVVLLHGGGTNHALVLFLLRGLVGRYHILCPDLPGHAGFSAETRIDPRGDDFGHWLDQTLAEL